MNELISVIVPVYNVEHYLDQCICSIINQSYKELEIILIDDGSEDLSGSLCDRWREKDNRIKVLHQINQGLAVARNIGIKMSEGNYIVCVDSDDYISKKMVEDLYIEAVTSNADIVACRTECCNEDGKMIKTQENLSSKKEYCGKEQLKALFMNNSGVTTTAWGKLYKKRLFEKIEYPAGKYHEDIYTTYKLLALSKKTCIISSSCYVYRQVSKSITHSAFQKQHMDYLYACKERAEYVKSNYPEFSKKANASIAYSACKLLKKKMHCNNTDIFIEMELKKAIRDNLVDFLVESQSKITTKVFAVVVSINTGLAKLFIDLLNDNHI